MRFKNTQTQKIGVSWVLLGVGEPDNDTNKHRRNNCLAPEEINPEATHLLNTPPGSVVVVKFFNSKICKY